MSTANDERATRAEDVLKRFAELNYGDLACLDDWFSATSDLLADLRHVARKRGFSFAAAAETSQRHFDIEVAEDAWPLGGSAPPGN